MSNSLAYQPAPPSAEAMRSLAWELGELRSADAYLPTVSHCALMFVNPRQAFVHFRLLASWIDTAAAGKGERWRNCRMLVRLYDTTDIEFNGFNAHSILNVYIQHIAGHAFIALPRTGRVWMAEVGFELRDREFVAAARSLFCQAPPESPSPRTGHDALFVDAGFNVQTVGNIFDQGAFLEELRRPKMRGSLRIAHLALEASALGDVGQSATFVTELAAAQSAEGHSVHVYLPQKENLQSSYTQAGVVYHALNLNNASHSPLEMSHAYAAAAETALREQAYDLVHCHEWMSGEVLGRTSMPSVLSLSSLENTRLNGAPPTPLSAQIAACEAESAARAGLVLVPDWLRSRALEAGIDGSHLVGFPMEGRIASEWDETLDEGKVKMEMGFGPLDRVLIYIGPLEHESGVDILFDALPTLLHRSNNVRLALVGSGNLFDHLNGRAWNSGFAHAVKLLGDVRGDAVARYLRASTALVLPSRTRVAFDEAVIEMARRAGKPVVTTHGGPAHRVRHEETGIITYDNPGSMVWALDRILGDAAHTERMGLNGKTDSEPRTVSWPELALRYFSLCLERFPALTKEPGVRGQS